MVTDARNIIGVLTTQREEFTRLDTAAMRDRFFSTQVPPPGSTQVHTQAGELEAEYIDRPYSCPATDQNGEACQARFETKRALATHLRFTAGGTDEVRAHEQRCEVPAARIPGEELAVIEVPE